MSVYAISYDLKAPQGNYEGLFEELRKSPWWHYLESTWLLQSDETATQLWERLARRIQPQDRLLIIRVGNDYSGWLPKEAWDWIGDKLQGDKPQWYHALQR